MGIKTVNVLPNDGEGICVIRSHGASLEVLKEIKDKGFEIVDLTCPDVKKVQNKAIELALEGYFVIILGRAEHPEVIAISSNAKSHAKNPEDVFVAESLDSIKEIEEKIKKQDKIGIVVQTTQRVEYLNEVVDYLRTFCKDIRIMNTICASTSLRQNEAKTLAQESDLMVVVGSKKSANTTHLAEILKDITNTVHIENAEELDLYKDLIENSQKISITAGASTPQDIIEKVISKLKLL